ncbi:fructose PTS transporter subunit IIA [uncultured Granulicatella sp.]|uniref:PTS sugar transporter subunit IIA n=1 Tax=uncultured Granulicatella sp. TaxID=316089 RepID=UPI0028DB6F20|nr:fructose PTS transporter subunit IIA [uncultured Granulicatella sp.]
MTKEIDLSKIISKDLLIVDSVSESKQEVLLELANLLEKKEYITNAVNFLDDVYLRESEGITGIGNGIAIPHGKSKAVKKTTVAIAVLKNEINWETLDEKGVKVVILFAVQDTDATTTHILLLQQVAILLANDSFLDSLKEVSSIDQLYQIFVNEK